MTTTYPTTVQAHPNPGPTTLRNDPGFELDVVVATLGDTLEAVQTKLGTGSSVAAANQVLRGTATGATAFGQVQTGDLAGAACTQLAQANLGASTSSVAPTWATAAAIGPTTFAGGQVRLDVLLLATIPTSRLVYLGYNVDGGTDVQIGLMSFVGGAFMTFTCIGFLGALGGSHTVNVRWMVTGDTLSAQSGSKGLVTEFKR